MDTENKDQNQEIENNDEVQAAKDVFDEKFQELEIDEPELEEEEVEEENEGDEDNQLEPEPDKSEDEESEEEVESEEEASEEGDEDYEYIPEEQVRVARSIGLSDEEIVNLSPETLEKMVERHRKEVSSSPREVDEKVEPKVDEKKDEIPLLDPMDYDVSELDPDMQKFAKMMLDHTNKLTAERNDMAQRLNGIDEVKQEIQNRDTRDFNRRIDGIFDELSENLPEVGNSTALDGDSQKIRNELFGIATSLMNTRGISHTEAINEAAFMWKMAQVDLDDLEKKATEGLKRKLNKQKKRMTPRPGGRKTKKKFKSKEAEALDTLEKGLESVWSEED